MRTWWVRLANALGFYQWNLTWQYNRDTGEVLTMYPVKAGEAGYWTRWVRYRHEANGVRP